MKNTPARLLVLLPLLLALGGCASKTDEPEDHPLSTAQQERALLHSRPPQQFGFSVYPTPRGITYSGQGRLHPNHFTSADMIEEGIPVIGMRGRAQRNKLNALIDTSSPHSWMEFSVSRDFDAFFMEMNSQPFPYIGEYNTGGVMAFAAVVTQLRIDNLFIESVPFYVRMSRGSLGPMSRGIREPPVDAVLGYDNLRAFEYIQFDLRDNRINFSASTPYTPVTETAADVALIVRAPGHGLAVEGIIDGKPVPVLLDMAGDFSLARGDARVGATREVQIGDLTFEDVPTLLLPVHNVPPRIGRQLLESYRVTICNRERMVYFEKYPDDD